MTNVHDIIIVAIQRFEQQGVLKEETTGIIQQYLDAPEQTQRDIFDNNAVSLNCAN